MSFVNSLLIALMLSSAFAEDATSNDKVGDIKFSILTLQQFQNEHGDGWVLMEGQKVDPQSKLALYGWENIPDARGMFLRGKQHGRTEGGNLEGDLRIGSEQKDELKAHTHSGSWPYGSGRGPVNQLNASPGHDAGQYKSQNVSISEFGGKETRPANITVNIFIKIK